MRSRGVLTRPSLIGPVLGLALPGAFALCLLPCSAQQIHRNSFETMKMGWAPPMLEPGRPPERGRTVLVPGARRKVWPDSPTNTRLSPPPPAASTQSRLSAICAVPGGGPPGGTADDRRTGT